MKFIKRFSIIFFTPLIIIGVLYGIVKLMDTFLTEGQGIIVISLLFWAILSAMFAWAGD